MKKKLNCVLLVDDNDSDNFIHKRVIEKAGITDHIAIALNGREAIDFLTNKIKGSGSKSVFIQPDLLFLDINMPVMDGWDFLEEYQKLEDDQKGKVVVMMLTTSVNPADKTKTEITLGSDCFKFKPLTLEMVHDIMKRHFSDYL